MSKINFFILGIIFFLSIYSCLTINNIHYTYLSSENGEKILTFLQYHNYGDPESACNYIVYGKMEKNGKLPQKDYVKITCDTDPIWINWDENGKINILYSMGKVICNKFDIAKIEMKYFYSEVEFNDITKGNAKKYEEIYLSKFKYF